jgi:hypothetical protein
MNMILKENDHLYNYEWPGSVFNKKWKKVIVPLNIMHLRNFFSDMHYHLYVKYWVAKAIKENNNVDIWRKIYDKMQEKRIGISCFNKFESLLDSIYWEGYNPMQAIPVDNAFNILDGSHRLAWLAVLWEHPLIEVIDYSSHNYDKWWFIDNWFSQQELKFIHEVKRDFFLKYNWNLNQKQLGFIWWSTIQELWWNWNQIISLIWIEKLSDFYIRNFGSQLKYIINLAYLSDWIDSRTLIEKNDWIMKRSNWLIWILTYDNVWEEEIRLIKDKVRNYIIPQLSEYNFDSIIHSVDIAHPTSNKIRLEMQRYVDQMNALLYI